VNLPAKDKMTAPRYQDIAPDKIPETTLAPGVVARVLAGEAGTVRGPVEADATQALYIDVRLEAGSRVELKVPEGHNGFVYVYQGQAHVGDGVSKDLMRGDLGILGRGDRVNISTDHAPARLILVAGKPFNEPVAKYGPFVMNTQKEIVQAVEDFRAGKF
jgi:quercetin 2,3-dioxygenase